MKPPDVEESIFDNLVYRVCQLAVYIIIFFNRLYVAAEEGVFMISLKDNNPE